MNKALKPELPPPPSYPMFITALPTYVYVFI